MGKVTGIGGIFFKCKDVQATKKWYEKNLGLSVNEYGCSFTLDTASSQHWSPFEQDTDYFNPGEQDFMINYIVDDLESLLTQLKANNVTIIGDVASYEYGTFAWILDIDNRKIELWQPLNEHLL